MSGEYSKGWNAAIAAAEAIAIQWRDENKAALSKARKGYSFYSSDLADQLDGAAIECNAIAGEIRRLALSQEQSQ